MIFKTSYVAPHCGTTFLKAQNIICQSEFLYYGDPGEAGSDIYVDGIIDGGEF